MAGGCSGIDGLGIDGLGIELRAIAYGARI